jgi:REP element-mobilizing transposase RayT
VSPLLSLGETLFVTFRLECSIHSDVGRQLQAELQQNLELIRASGLSPEEQHIAHQRAQKRFFAKFDAALDVAEIGPTYLEKEKVAEIVAGELMLLEDTGVQVLAFALLPNHVHAVLHLPAANNLSFYKSLQLLHQRTAALCSRKIRLPAGADFWQTGSYEYPVYDADELARIITYVQRHAKRLRLPARWHDWPYVYVAPKYLA